MYYSCHCIKRNGLQHDCRRTGCGGEPACLVLPDPLCAPSQLARARGLADPAPFTAHMHTQGGGGFSGTAESGSGVGKRFIVCELKGIVPDAHTGQGGSTKCCKCPGKNVAPPSTSTRAVSNLGPTPQVCLYNTAVAQRNPKINTVSSAKCPCTCGSALAKMQDSIFAFDEETMNKIMKRFDKKELASSSQRHGGRGATKSIGKEEEPCSRPGCLHWQPPPPCVWDAPCKADCFETPAGIQPGRNPLTGGGGAFISSGRSTGPKVSQQLRQKMKLLTPECSPGCCSAGKQGQVGASGGPAAGLPMLVMKLC